MRGATENGGLRGKAAAEDANITLTVALALNMIDRRAARQFLSATSRHERESENTDPRPQARLGFRLPGSLFLLRRKSKLSGIELETQTRAK